MPRTVRVFQVDAFTDRLFSGNPAGVVLDAQHLDDGEMLAIARELNNGDTAFVLPASGGDHDLAIRFFTPRKEAPFVGHATLAAHAVLQRLAPLPLRRQSGRTGIVEVRAPDPAVPHFTIRQSAPALGRTVSAAELDEVLALLGLSASQVDPRCAVRIAGGASTRLLLGVADAGALDACRPQLRELAALSARLGAQGYFLFALRTTGAGVETEARMFCPALGIDEDPVSGNAHAMLGVHLQAAGLLPSSNGTARFTGAQGRHVGRPGRVTVEVEIGADGRPVAATIGGSAVIVFETTLRL